MQKIFYLFKILLVQLNGCISQKTVRVNCIWARKYNSNHFLVVKQKTPENSLRLVSNDFLKTFKWSDLTTKRYFSPRISFQHCFKDIIFSFIRRSIHVNPNMHWLVLELLLYVILHCIFLSLVSCTKAWVSFIPTFSIPQAWVLHAHHAITT